MPYGKSLYLGYRIIIQYHSPTAYRRKLFCYNERIWYVLARSLGVVSTCYIRDMYYRTSSGAMWKPRGRKT